MKDRDSSEQISSTFGNRPEDFLNKGMKAAAGFLPVVGGSIAEFLQFVVGDPAQERRDEFLKGTFLELTDLRDRFESLDAEALRNNEQFQATVVQAVRIEAATASAAKKEMLRNAILNSAVGTIDENVRHVFMVMIEQFTPMHLALLKLLQNPKANEVYVNATKNLMMGSMNDPISKALPEVTREPAMFSRVTEDLHRYGCTNISSFNGMMTGGASMQNKMTTSFGDSFIAFVSAP